MKLKEIYESYKKGELLSGELKKLAIDKITEFVLEFQKRRNEIDQDVIDKFMKPHKLTFGQEERLVAAKPKEKKSKK